MWPRGIGLLREWWRWLCAPPFAPLVRMQIAHAAGDALIAAALANTLFFAAPDAETARTRVGLYLLLTLAPYALAAPVVTRYSVAHEGHLVRMLSGAAAVRALLAIAIAFEVHTLAVYPFAFALLVASRVSTIARRAIVPSVVPSGRTVDWANSQLAIVTIVAGGIVAPVGLGMSAVTAPAVAAFLAAAAYGVSVWYILRVDVAPTQCLEVRSTRPRIVARTVPGRVLAAAAGLGTLRIMAGLITFVAAFVLREHGGNLALGAAVTVAGAGTILGSWTAGRLSAHDEMWTIRGSLVLVIAGGALVLALDGTRDARRARRGSGGLGCRRPRRLRHRLAGRRGGRRPRANLPSVRDVVSARLDGGGGGCDLCALWCSFCRERDHRRRSTRPCTCMRHETYPQAPVV